MVRILALSLFAAVCAPIAQARAAGVPLTIAIDAAKAALAACKASGYEVTVTILDADVSTRVVLRGDGARDGTVQIGYRKAYTVIKTGMSSADFAKTVPPAAAPAAGASKGPPGPVNGDPNLITWAGGLPIRSGDALIGAISASGAPGGDKDEACARSGLAVISDRLK